MKTIHHVLDVEASPATAWAALTDVRGLAGWWSTRVKTQAHTAGGRVEFTFAGDFNPVMQITGLDPERELGWRCVGGHEPWADNEFRFQLAGLGDGRTRLRFWQEYATELGDDQYGSYNYNWGFYLDSFRLYCETGTGKPFQA